MKESEAIEKLKNMRLYMQIEDKNNDCKFTEDDYKANEMAIKALEKQIPKKPTPIDYEKYIDVIDNARLLRGAYWCPNCKRVVKSGSFCNDCGQKLDWSDEKMKENVCITCEYYEKCNKPEREIKCMGYKEKEKENE